MTVSVTTDHLSEIHSRCASLLSLAHIQPHMSFVTLCIVAKAETMYLPVRTKCLTFVTTPLGVVVVVCVIKTTWPLVVFDQYVRN